MRSLTPPRQAHCQGCLMLSIEDFVPLLFPEEVGIGQRFQRSLEVLGQDVRHKPGNVLRALRLGTVITNYLNHFTFGLSRVCVRNPALITVVSPKLTGRPPQNRKALTGANRPTVCRHIAQIQHYQALCLSETPSMTSSNSKLWPGHFGESSVQQQLGQPCQSSAGPVYRHVRGLGGVTGP